MSQTGTATDILFTRDTRAAHAARREATKRTLPYLGTAVPVGVAGALTVAVYVFFVDLLAGHPFGTPSALGASLFRGEPFDLAAPVSAVLVAGYTLVHVAAFVALAAGAASAEQVMTERGVPLAQQILAGVFGLGTLLTALFVALTMLLGLEWIGGVGFERIVAANAIASMAMTLALIVRRDLRNREQERILEIPPAA